MGEYSELSKKLAGYVYGDLDPGEAAQIQGEISQDKDLADSYRLNVKVRDYLKAKLQLEEMRNDPDLEQAMLWADLTVVPDQNPVTGTRIRQSSGPGRHKLRKPLWIASAVAASIVLMLCLKTLMQQEPGKLYYSYYQPFEASNFTRRGDAEEAYRNVTDAINTYLSGDYAETVRLFGQISSDPGLMPEVYFFRGLSYLGLGMFENAETELQSCIIDGTRYRPEALWYLSLCKLRMEKYDEAGDLLVELEYYAGMYGELARDLGRKISRIRK
jgi:tetratricopeptide (TPR) repeat protein